MVDTSITVNDYDTFIAEAEKLFEKSVKLGHPIKVSGAYGHDDLTGCIMFCRWNGKDVMDTVHTGFKIGENVFGVIANYEQRLLDAGLLVDDKYVEGATHIVTIAHGIWADTKLPVLHEYRFRGDDIEALLMTIKFGGRLKKIDGSIPV